MTHITPENPADDKPEVEAFGIPESLNRVAVLQDELTVAMQQYDRDPTDATVARDLGMVEGALAEAQDHLIRHVETVGGAAMARALDTPRPTGE